MANVKISDLPAATTIHSNDVMIINDTSSSTTKKVSMNTWYGNQANITLGVSDGITINNANALSAYIRNLAPCVYLLYLQCSSFTVTNNTSSAQTLTLTFPNGFSFAGMGTQNSPVNSRITGLNAYSGKHLVARANETGVMFAVNSINSNGDNYSSQLSIASGGSIGFPEGLYLPLFVYSNTPFGVQ